MPHAISNLSNQLTYLFLGGNFIFGSIPHDIGNLESLQTFKVEQSLLTGELPTSLGMQIRKAPVTVQYDVRRDTIFLGEPQYDS